MSETRRKRLTLRRLSTSTRYAVLGASMLAMLVFAGTAYAINIYYAANMAPGGFASTSGWNNRDYNRGCDDVGFGNGGYTAVGYYDTSMNLQYYSGSVYTNCGDGAIARLENDGYFKARCWNKATYTYRLVCQTTP